MKVGSGSREGAGKGAAIVAQTGIVLSLRKLAAAT
jgi:hypothetical protein